MALTGVKAEPRFFAPVIAPMLLTLALTFHAIHATVSSSSWRRWFVATLLAVTLSLWLAQWIAANTTEIRQWSRYGSDGYGERRWAESATAASLRSGGHDGLLFSNNSIAAYLLARDGATPRAGVTPLRPRMAPNSKVAWFYRAGEVPSLMEFLRSFPRMKVIATYADGIVFQQGATHADDTADQFAEALLRDVSEGILVATSHFNVYFAGEVGGGSSRLMYVKHGCEPADTRPMFFLHVTPENPDNLPVGRTGSFWRPVLPYFHNLDFRFATRGVRHRGVCIVTHALPSYAIAEIRTGQWSRGPRGEIWSTRFTVPPKRSP